MPDIPPEEFTSTEAVPLPPTLDLNRCTQPQFATFIEELERYRRSLGELPKLDLPNGWYSLTPELALQLLLRYPPKMNRKASLGTVRYYGRQVLADDWAPTHQAIGITESGLGIDGFQRALAVYLTGHPIPKTYVISDVPHSEYLFAYIDNGRPRTPAVALATAGQDGLSPFIYQIIRIRTNVDSGAYSTHRATRLPMRLSPMDVLRVVNSDDKLRQAAHLTAGDYRSVVQLIGHKDVTGYCSYKILSLCNEVVLEDFMTQLADPESELPEDHPIAALRSFLDRNRRSQNPLPKHLVLAHVTKAFGLWQAGASVRKLKVTVDEDFPIFEAATENAE